MGKGRKYGADRLLGTAAATSNGYYYGNEERLADLDEHDVWSTAAAVEPDQSMTRAELDRHGQPRTRRWGAGGLSLVFDAGGGHGHAPPGAGATSAVHQPIGRRHVASSAPVSVPEWPGRYGSTEPVAGLVGPDQYYCDRDDGEWVPPHEYVARSGRGAGVTTSVFEGVGRTLKGRDMSRVRDAVWSQTGFFG